MQSLVNVVVAERLSDVLHDVDATHAQVIFVREDAGKSSHGYAQVRHGLQARYGGIAVAWEAAAIDGLPDPILLLVRETTGPDPTRASLCLRRVGLPVLIKVDALTGEVWLLREILSPSGERIGVAHKRSGALPPLTAGTVVPAPPPPATPIGGALAPAPPEGPSLSEEPPTPAMAWPGEQQEAPTETVPPEEVDPAEVVGE